MTFTKEAILERLLASYSGPGNGEEGSFAGDVLRACADALAELWSMEIDGLEYRAFVSTAVGDWLTKVCADRGVYRQEHETDADLRSRALARLAEQPSSGNADHYTYWCDQVPDLLRVRVLPLNRGAGTVDIVSVNASGKCPDQAIIDEAQRIVDENRPVGADARVIGATETPVDIAGTVTLMDSATLSSVQSSFESAITTFFRDTALLTSTISYAKVLRLLMDVPGVADVTNFSVSGKTVSTALEPTAVAILGSVSLTEAQA